MTKFLKAVIAFCVAVPFVTMMTVSSARADKIRIALAETPSDELAAFFVALERAKANGLDYEWTAFSDEELAIQAVLSGQMDIGFGTPYAAMQRSRAPIRIVFQLSKLKFFPVTSKKYSKLEDLNGEPIMLHSRGGGTDSIANVIEDKLDIKFGKRSYVPGSSNRIAALIAGQTDATIVDLSNKNKLMKLQGDKFNVLPMFEVDHSCQTPCTHNPLGVKGCGEAGAIGSPPSVVNAVIDALQSGGHTVTHIDMPVSPSRVWQAMQG